ncbi:hypothetical protein RNJ44_00032 [Nakaseomyces bracarensis]|uniref:ABC1 atypical kinase-like domain-containing protein n=1 Tax=Nakaseomyces bracarensis TaxID=273131 RepID=A0ABR4P117_9SACH
MSLPTLIRNLTRPQNVVQGGKRARFYDKRWVKIVGVGTVGAGILYATNEDFHKSVRHSYYTLKRFGVVTQALGRCVYHYKRVLYLNDSIENEHVRDENLSKCHLTAAKITLRALEKNGGVFIKLGQHIGAMTYILPPEWTQTMVPLQDHCPESSLEEIDEMFTAEMGGEDLASYFEWIENDPIGVASLAQVHRAKLRNGTKEVVAVKFQHPQLYEHVSVDVKLTQFVFDVLDKIFPQYSLLWLADELHSSIYDEINFNKEAQNALLTTDFFYGNKKLKQTTSIRIPRVIDHRHRVLIMEYVGGARLDDPDFLDKHHIKRNEVSESLAHIFNSMIFTDGAGIHCDPHMGNIAIKAQEPTKENGYKNYEIVLYDHGLYRYPELETRRNYAKLWLSVLDRDQTSMRKWSYELAGITDEEFPLFAAAITGRSVEKALNYDINSVRDSEEIQVMRQRMFNAEPHPQGQTNDVESFEGNIAFKRLMQILAHIPRIVLLLLKTNDLTRFLDESLQNPLGPARGFLILTTYCCKLVLNEDLETAMNLWASKSYFAAISKYVTAWYKYISTAYIRVNVYDSLLRARDLIK